MNSRLRRRFDEELEWVLKRMPPLVHDLIEQIPLHVEDYPSKEVMKQTGVEYLDDLCGFYTGIPIGDKGETASLPMPDVVTIYREGILSSAADDDGHVATERLRDEIRITILHELAHHHGFSDEELEQLGYG